MSKRPDLAQRKIMTSQYELLNAKRIKDINRQLSLINGSDPLSGDAEKRIASLAYINADFTSGMGVLSGLLGVVSLLIAIFTTELDLPLKIIIGVAALMLLIVAIGAGYKFFNQDTAKQAAFTIDQQRCAEKSRTDSALILDGIEKLTNRKAIRETNSNIVRPRQDPNTKLWLSLLVVLAITARKRRS